MSPASILFVVVSLLPGSAAVAAPAESWIKSAADYSKANGGQTMVVSFDGKRVFEQYGNGGAVDQLQGLVSGVKSFVGVVAVAAVADGLIRLDDPASESITEWKDDPA